MGKVLKSDRFDKARAAHYFEQDVKEIDMFFKGLAMIDKLNNEVGQAIEDTYKNLDRARDKIEWINKGTDDE